MFSTTWIACLAHILLKACVHAAQQTEASGHSGILESAKGVLEDLQFTGVLEQLMLHPPVSRAVNIFSDKNYDCVCC